MEKETCQFVIFDSFLFLRHNVENHIVVEIDSKIHMNLKHKYFKMFSKKPNYVSAES